MTFLSVDALHTASLIALVTLANLWLVRSTQVMTMIRKTQASTLSRCFCSLHRYSCKPLVLLPIRSIIIIIIIPVVPQSTCNDADFQYQYDTSTNPYTSLSVMQMPSPPWNIPSQPQVQIPPQFVGYGQRLLANQNQNSNYQSLALQHPGPYFHLALGVSYPSDAVCDPFNLDAPVFLDQPDTGNQELRDDIAEVEPTPIVPSHIVSVIPRYPLPNLNVFLPEFAEPVLSKDWGCVVTCQVVRTSSRALETPSRLRHTQKMTQLFVFIGDRATGEERRGRGSVVSGAASQFNLEFDHSNDDHQRIVRNAMKEVTKHALNLAALTEEGDRVAIADQKLEEAAKHILGKEQGIEWASHNAGMLYMTLSEPCKNIMHMCKKHACNLVCDGFGLRLPIWTQASETEYQDAVIGDLLDEQFFPPKFVMGQGTDDELHFLENEVVLNVILDTVRELKLVRYLEDPGSLACAAAAAVRCAIEKAKSKVLTTNDVEFSGATFKNLYTRLMTHIEVKIRKCPQMRKRWEDYKTCIKVRLAQYK
ncbi:hypothetical protein EDD22DRAFT_847297 [Suillus occidentalis]|nr:hypothetical protein EDD22DRAFT_847297 [Suillus occidentalis]